MCSLAPKVRDGYLLNPCCVQLKNRNRILRSPLGPGLGLHAFLPHPRPHLVV